MGWEDVTIDDRERGGGRGRGGGRRGGVGGGGGGWGGGGGEILLFASPVCLHPSFFQVPFSRFLSRFLCHVS